MQFLVTIEQHNIALLFANYLNSLGIQAEISSSEKSYSIYCAEQDIEQAAQLFNEFIQQPFDPKYQQAAWQQGELTQVKTESLSQFKQQFLAHAGVVTLTVFSLSWLVFLASILGFANTIFASIQFFPQLSIHALLTEPYRLLGPAFFHFSWLHIVFNTMWWWQLGGMVEQKLGKWSLINLFLVSAIISNLGQFIVSGPEFGGLSGVVYGLVGYIWWLGWLAPEKGLVLPKPLVGILLFWMMLGFIEVLPVNMANTAHLLGLLSGCLLAWLKAQKYKS